MTAAATDKQLAYIADLTETAIGKLRNGTPRPQAGAQVALILALPTPATAADASDIINALKSGSAMSYWRADARKADAQAIMAKLAAAFGNDMSGAPAARPIADTPDYLDIIRAAIA